MEHTLKKGFENHCCYPCFIRVICGFLLSAFAPLCEFFCKAMVFSRATFRLSIRSVSAAVAGRRGCDGEMRLDQTAQNAKSSMILDNLEERVVAKAVAPVRRKRGCGRDTMPRSPPDVARRVGRAM